MEGLSSYNVTVEALHVVSEVYSFCQHQLGNYNVLLPEFDQVVSIVTSTFGFILTHSPAIVRQLYSFIPKLSLLEYNFVTIFLLMALLYTVYCILMSTFRWFRRLVYGFGKFCFAFFAIYGLIYVFQYFLDNTPTHSSKSTTRTRNY